MNEEIKDFLQKQRIATICCVDEQSNPYCFTCFYLFQFQYFLLIFKSSATSHHVSLLQEKQQVSGTVLPEKTGVFPVKGIQFSGILCTQPAQHLLEIGKEHYYKKFPLALTIPGELFLIKLETIKMTNSAKILGKKVIWRRNSADIKGQL